MSNGQPRLPALASDAIARPSGPARPELRHQDDAVGRKPDWLRVRMRHDPAYFEVRDLVRGAGLNTVCESASCPNIGECWGHKTLTFMILGDVCTRSCGFCDVQTGKPGAVDTDEPRRVAESLARLGLRYAVVTSVDRDDLDDGGAAIWAETIRRIKAATHTLELEVLTPDFKGDAGALDTVLDARPDVFAHNLETVQRLHRVVRPQARHARSLHVLEHASRRGFVAKSGLMLGLGERFDEVLGELRRLADAGVRIVTLGQYLRPSDRHLPLDRWVHPDEFVALADAGHAMGIEHVEAGPLVRSSFRADRQAAALRSRAAPAIGVLDVDLDVDLEGS